MCVYFHSHTKSTISDVRHHFDKLVRMNKSQKTDLVVMTGEMDVLTKSAEYIAEELGSLICKAKKSPRVSDAVICSVSERIDVHPSMDNESHELNEEMKQLVKCAAVRYLEL